MGFFDGIIIFIMGLYIIIVILIPVIYVYIYIWLVVSDMTFAIFPKSWDDDPIWRSPSFFRGVQIYTHFISIPWDIHDIHASNNVERSSIFNALIRNRSRNPLWDGWPPKRTCFDHGTFKGFSMFELLLGYSIGFPIFNIIRMVEQMVFQESKTGIWPIYPGNVFSMGYLLIQKGNSWRSERTVQYLVTGPILGPWGQDWGIFRSDSGVENASVLLRVQ